jgi:hypothetical protein
MEIPCEIDNIKTLKKGMKITLTVNDENVKPVMKDIYNFIDRSLLVDFEINSTEEQEKMNQISPAQRKKIYAIINDIAEYTGDNQDYVKELLKKTFIQNTEYEDFSLSNCSRELTNDFMEFIVRVAFRQGVPMKENPFTEFDEIERAMAMCVKYKKCAICGRDGEIHHCEGSRVGMGRDRNKVDDSDSKFIALCRKHHTELHNMSESDFMEKYHVKGIKIEQ